MKTAPLLFAALIIAACATPPGRLTDADFVTRIVDIPLPLARVAFNVQEGFRWCGSETGSPFSAVPLGVPDCLPLLDDGSQLCDVWVGQTGGGRSDWVLGRIKLTPSDHATTATLQVQTWVAKKKQTLDAWELFLHGRYREACD